MNAREIGIMAPLVILTIVLGFYPKPVFDTASGAVNAMIAPYQQAIGAHQAHGSRARLAELQNRASTPCSLITLRFFPSCSSCWLRWFF